MTEDPRCPSGCRVHCHAYTGRRAAVAWYSQGCMNTADYPDGRCVQHSTHPLAVTRRRRIVDRRDNRVRRRVMAPTVREFARMTSLTRAYFRLVVESVAGEVSDDAS